MSIEQSSRKRHEFKSPYSQPSGVDPSQRIHYTYWYSGVMVQAYSYNENPALLKCRVSDRNTSKVEKLLFKLLNKYSFL